MTMALEALSVAATAGRATVPPTPRLRILHISARDNYGGSGRAAYRIHTELRRLGWRSRMLVARKQTEDSDVAPVWGTLPGRLMDRTCGRIAEALGLSDVFYPSSLRLLGHPWLREADIVQLYNLHGGYFSFMSVKGLSRRRPVVWRLDDMWALTGHCGYSYECTRWRTGCGSCPYLSESPAVQRDTTALLWRMKARAYQGARLTLVAPSRWMADLARESPLLQRFPVHIIPYGVDLDVFHPIPKTTAREQLGLPRDGYLILFSARALSERRKGASVLHQALTALSTPLRQKTTLLMVGDDPPTWPQRESLQLKMKALGFLSDDRLLAAAYSAADVFVLPTLADNLPNGLIESMACGTPAVTFNVGGCPEVIRHMETGYLASAGSAADLSKGLQLLLTDNRLRERMALTCRRTAEQEYSLERQVTEYLNLYRDLYAQRWTAVREAR